MSTKDKLLGYYTETEPLGSPKWEITAEQDVIDSLFYKYNLIYREIRNHPSLIIGRRGTGKTAFLNSLRLDPRYQLKVDLSMDDAFTAVVYSVHENLRKGPIIPEKVSHLWRTMFWHAIFLELAAKQGKEKQLVIVRKYISGIGLSTAKNPYGVMQTFMRILAAKAGDNVIGAVADFVDQHAFEGVVFTEAEDAANDFFQNKKMSVILMLDTLDSFDLSDKRTSHAITGLLKCQASFASPGSHCRFVCCIPAELYHELLLLSSNPAKDFRHKVLLHWHAAELIRLAGRRFSNFLELRYPGFYRKFSHIDFRNKAGALRFWESILPSSVRGEEGIIEDPIAYILRHTQLQPRYLIMYLNSIIEMNLRETGNPVNIKHDSVLGGVQATAELVCRDIFSGFKYRYPGALHACERCIPFLPLRFDEGKLHTVYNQRGKNTPDIYEYEDFRNMLVEMGAVGRVEGETDRYIIGRFEYTEPHKLITSPLDELCLHPLFSLLFKKELKKEVRAVYPFGTDIDETEYRDIT